MPDLRVQVEVVGGLLRRLHLVVAVVEIAVAPTLSVNLLEGVQLKGSVMRQEQQQQDWVLGFSTRQFPRY
jgi:uncharacterized protein YhbP (UPF0306 family)